jgi:tetratricopeptide (TPR) repeat protein
MKEVVFKRTGLPLMMAIMLSIVSTLVAQGQENPAIRQSRQFIYNDQPEKAINILNEAIKAAPTDASLLYYLGRAQIIVGQNQQAEITFQKGIDLNGKEYLNVAGKGHLRMVENNVAEAKQLLEQALTSTKSKNVAVLTAVGDAYLANDKFNNEALAALQKAKSAGSTDPHTYILLGDANAKLGKGGDAVSAYEKAASLDPKSGFPHYKIGVVYFRAQNKDAAEQSLIKATTVDPNTILAHKELGEFYYVQKQYAKAVKSHEAYLALLDKSDAKKADDAEFKHAFYLFANKEYSRANEIFKKLAAKPDATANVFKYYFYSLVEAKSYDEAKNMFVQYTTRFPDALTASDWKYYGKMLLDTKQDSLAVDAYNNSLKLDSAQTELQQTVAEVNFKLKRYPEAIAAYKALEKLKNNKLTSQDLYTFGRAYYVTQQFDQADSTFNKLAEVQPNSTVPYLWLARTKSSIDSTSEKGLAKPYFEKLVEKASANPEKGKADIIESYLYLGYYHFIKNEIPMAKSYYEKILAMNPDPKSKGIADEAIKAINNIGKGPAQKPKKGGMK